MPATLVNRTRTRASWAVTLLLTGVGWPAAWGEQLPGFDFTRPEVAGEWLPTHDVAAVTRTGEATP
jgi:hypothetical protein